MSYWYRPNAETSDYKPKPQVGQQSAALSNRTNMWDVFTTTAQPEQLAATQRKPVYNTESIAATQRMPPRRGVRLGLSKLVTNSAKEANHRYDLQQLLKQHEQAQRESLFFQKLEVSTQMSQRQRQTRHTQQQYDQVVSQLMDKRRTAMRELYYSEQQQWEAELLNKGLAIAKS